MSEDPGSRPGDVLARIRSQAPALLPTERAVAMVLLEHRDAIVELSSQQVAELAGASRATVVRTCQSLGFSGYQQLRVLVARDAAYADGQRTATVHDGPAADVFDSFAQVHATVEQMAALLDADQLARAVGELAAAGRVLVVGNGLSAPLAIDAAARLTAIGRNAETQTDGIGQQVTARLLTPGDILLVISGSGASATSLATAHAARASGACVVALTAFSHSALATLADIALVAGMPDSSFGEELTITSRIPQAILIEGLVTAIARELSDTADAARAVALEVIGDNLTE